MLGSHGATSDIASTRAIEGCDINWKHQVLFVVLNGPVTQEEAGQRRVTELQRQTGYKEAKRRGKKDGQLSKNEVPTYRSCQSCWAGDSHTEGPC